MAGSRIEHNSRLPEKYFKHTCTEYTFTYFLLLQSMVKLDTAIAILILHEKKKKRSGCHSSNFQNLNNFS